MISLKPILENFIKITTISKKELNFGSEVCSDLYLLARYYNGIVIHEYCKTNIKTEFGRVMLFILWITKLENQDNNSQFVYDLRFFNQKNIWELIKTDSLRLRREEIKEFSLNLISGLESNIKCLIENIDNIYYNDGVKFVDKYKEIIVSCNAISFKEIIKDDKITWQEQYILDMLQVSIEEKEIVPIFTYGDNTIPDISLWTIETMDKIKEYFKCCEIDFIVDTLKYVLYNEKPGDKTILMHCELLSEALTKNINEIEETSSFKVLSYLFKEKLMQSLTNYNEYKQLLYKIQNIEDICLTIIMNDCGMPLCNTQREIIKKYYDNQFKNISTIDNINDFEIFIKNKDIAKQIDNDYYKEVFTKFNTFIANIDYNISIPNLFFYYMTFLVDLKSMNQKIEKKLVDEHMIIVQQLWENNFYKVQITNMKSISQSISIPTEEIDKINVNTIQFPYSIAINCIKIKIDDLIKTMDYISKNPLIHMVSRVKLAQIFPIVVNEIMPKYDDVDKCIIKNIENIIKDKGYKFLNILDNKFYYMGIIDEFGELAKMLAAFFYDEKQLYELISKKSPITLIKFDNDLNVAHLLQLFTLLEIKIREFGAMIGVVIFKEDKNNFLKYKDPCSILREVLVDVYSVAESFDIVQDLLFVYYIMYRSISLNIRNECIHGRDYIYGSRLLLAFKIALFSIHMIDSRIDNINENKML